MAQKIRAITKKSYFNNGGYENLIIMKIHYHLNLAFMQLSGFKGIKLNI